jgi:opacity protein-like surface antigen
VTVGGGFERRLTDAVTLPAEYRYTMLEEISMPVFGRLAEMTIDPSVHSAKLIATYRFSSGR